MALYYIPIKFDILWYLFGGFWLLIMGHYGPLRKMGHLYIKKKKLYLENKKTKDMFEKCFLEYFFLFFKIKI